MDQIPSRSTDRTTNRSSIINLNEIYQLFQDLPLEIAMYDMKGRYKFVNQLYEKDPDIRKFMIGKDDQAYFARKGINPEQAAKRQLLFKQATDERRIIKFTEKIEVPVQNKTFYYKRYYRPLFNSEGDIEYMFLFGNNLNAVIMSQRELEYMAYHDKLTGIKNRDAFQEKLEQLISENIKQEGNVVCGILLCDLNNFRLVNDSLGTPVGDLILKEVAARLNLCIEPGDMVFRYGGDEFIIILQGIKHEYDAGRIAEKISKYLAKPFYAENHKINYLTSSIGIVIYPRDGVDSETLIRNAHTAMVSAKRSGKNKFQFFTRAMTEISVRRLKIEKNLTELVNKGEFDKQLQILYQPIVEKNQEKEFKIIGAEALLRWRNPELGLVKTSKFIHIAEETNLISEIGEWLFQKSCTEYQRIQEKCAHPLYLSLNFSARQIRTPDIVEKIDKILYLTKFKPQLLQLELTETSYLDDHADVDLIIRQLKRMGIRLALDDFGVGFASLSYLHKVPASTIKIDRSFIKYMSTSQHHRELVKSIIVLGENLEKDVVAEGVEQVEDLYLLDYHRCYKYQGYLFSEPIELAVLEILLAKENLLTTLIQ